MFSAMTLGSSVYFLDKTTNPKYEVGELIGVSMPNFLANTVDIKVKIDGSIREFLNIPSINSVVTYNGGKLVISENKQGIQNEVESLLNNSKHIVENIETYKLNIIDCEKILSLLNPQFAKDKERDARLDKLENRFDGVESKLDKIFDLIKK